MSVGWALLSPWKGYWGNPVIGSFWSPAKVSLINSWQALIVPDGLSCCCCHLAHSGHQQKHCNCFPSPSPPPPINRHTARHCQEVALPLSKHCSTPAPISFPMWWNSDGVMKNPSGFKGSPWLGRPRVLSALSWTDLLVLLAAWFLTESCGPDHTAVGWCFHSTGEEWKLLLFFHEKEGLKRRLQDHSDVFAWMEY